MLTAILNAADILFSQEPPQGSLLGLVLFSAYINVAPFIANDNNMAPALYADETVATVRSVSIKPAVRK
jgi:hypothetical protein